jgi:putative queuosine salvage protein
MAASLPDQVRAACAEIAANARSVRIDLDALETLDPGPRPEMDPERHYLEGDPADVSAYVLALDAINFGSGWFPTLRKRRGPDGTAVSGYFTVAWGVADRFRALGPWGPADLRAMRAAEIAEVLGQPPDHELMALFAQALRQLGTFLGDRSALDVVAAAGGSAVRLAEQLAAGMAMFADRDFYKRAQITASDLELAGIAAFDDIDRLTIFADNLVPHVLRVDGVLVYDDRLAAHIDAGRRLRPGPQEREIRACAVHACALLARRTGMTERDIDNALWTRGGAPEYKAIPRHRCRTIFY